MEPMLTHVAGVDVHKEILAITVLIGDLNEEPKKTQFQCATFSEDLKAAGKRLLDMGVTHVAMESTGIYWKPVYNVWHAMGLIITLGNAYHLKNVPGRKTDTKDADWIAQLHRCGLIKASFIPDREFQQLRLLNRHRISLVDDIKRVKNRVQKILEDGNLKIGSVVSDVFCPAGMAVLDSIANGQTDTATLMGRVNEVGIDRFKKKENMRKALSNCLREDHCFLIKQLMLQYVDLNQRLSDSDGELDSRLKKYADLIARLDGIPGVDEITAKSIICEASTEMENFKDDRSFAAWSGVAPGNNESGGKKKRSKTRKGNPTLRKTLIQAAQGATKKKGSFYKAKYNRLIFKLGSKNKAKVAIANRIARAVYHIIKDGCEFKDIGAVRVESKDQQIKRTINKLKSLGVDVNFHYHQMIVEAKKMVQVPI